MIFCGRWRRIQDHLDNGTALPPGLEQHLAGCSFCSSRLTAYRRFLTLYSRAASDPRHVQHLSHRRPAAKRMLLAAAAMGLSLMVGGLLVPGYLQNENLKKEYARELAGSAIDGGLFEYADQFDTGYESDWFQQGS